MERKVCIIDEDFINELKNIGLINEIELKKEVADTKRKVKHLSATIFFNTISILILATSILILAFK